MTPALGRNGSAEWPPVIQAWVHSRGIAPQVLFALMCGGLSALVTNGRGSHPLVTYRRTYNLIFGVCPPTGWLRLACTCL
ncbi:hypothetical protein [Mycobacterium uberis]|uniref:hypothetical protein n=1 Tax=Mycobacterium uberis TaxID=2162698 RepID=UPI001A9E8381|nr:hypothetical protein [Mycobacterium uberis]